jgi:protein-L-isoaspartate(D-aspartate) O-methyltransferase
LSGRFTEADLAVVRRAFAAQILAVAGVRDNRALEQAFVSVPRERFVGRPPWQIVGRQGYRPVVSHDPVVLYQDINFALAPRRGVNNGSPVLHAMWLDALGPLTGARVVHIGAGTGYYSALLSGSSEIRATSLLSNTTLNFSSGRSATSRGTRTFRWSRATARAWPLSRSMRST